MDKFHGVRQAGSCSHCCFRMFGKRLVSASFHSSLTERLRPGPCGTQAAHSKQMSFFVPILETDNDVFPAVPLKTGGLMDRKELAEHE